MWFIIGIAVGLLLLWVVMSKKLSMKWYEWVIGLVGLALLLFTVLITTTSYAEDEPKAAQMFMLILGLPSLVLMVLAWQLSIRHKTAEKA
jgi:uncharacterized membrane protein